MRLELLPEALAELNDSIAFYEAQEPGLGERFFAAIAATIEFAVENPRLGVALPSPATGIRRFIVKRFPFMVLVAEVEGTTKVGGVTHTSRRPGYWHDRIK